MKEQRADFGTYTAPRQCVCGDKHAERATYWQHRLDAEAKREGERVMDAYKYQWSKRMDARHTITLAGAGTIDAALDATSCWRRDLRPGTPWRLVDASGAVRAEGVGPTQVA